MCGEERGPGLLEKKKSAPDVVCVLVETEEYAHVVIVSPDRRNGPFYPRRLKKWENLLGNNAGVFLGKFRETGGGGPSRNRSGRSPNTKSGPIHYTCREGAR